MKCPECEQLNPQGSEFCNSCGMALNELCSKCGHENPPSSQFCNVCGNNLQSATAADLDTHDRSGTAAGPEINADGERRQATVLFSDLSGYTGLGERLDPEDLNFIMGRVKDEFTRVIESYEGTVNQFIGDEVVAVFGIPGAHEDDPLRAVEAAFELHEIAYKLSVELAPRLDEPLVLHTGINTGLIVTQQRDLRDGVYGLTGDATNIGARLMSEAEADEILMGPQTEQFVRPYVLVEALDPVRLKGKAEAIVPYKAIGRTAVKSRFDAAETRGFTKYVGRNEEVSLFQSCLASLMDGAGQFITVEGEPGVGKSRLLYEFRHSVDQNQITVLEGRCQADGSNTPYLPILDALRRGLGLTPEDSESTQLEKVVNNAKAINSSLEEFIPHYLYLLSIKSDQTLPDSLQGKELRDALEQALSELLVFSAQKRPLVLMLEDWHWSDSASRSALAYLAGVISSHRLMIVVTTRPEASMDWGNLSYHTKIDVSSLDRTETVAIVKSILGVTELPDALVASIHLSTQGNPLFIEEACFSLIESDALTVRDGRAVILGKLQDLILPNTVQSIIRARLDRLEESANQVLCLAAVVGRVFSRRILDRLISTQIQLDETLHTLVWQDIIQQQRVVPEIEFTFRHILTREVAYETLLREQRKQLHGAVGEAIEELYAERLEEHVPVLAHHYLRSDRVDKAIEFSVQAGDRSANLYANAEATTYFENALEIALAQPASDEIKGLQVDIILKLANVGSSPHDIERDLKNLQSARELAEELKDDLRLAKILYWLGRLHYVLAELKPAVEYAGQSLAIADQLENESLAATAVNLMGRAYWQLSDFVRSAEMTERSIEQMRRIGNKAEESTAAGFVGALFGYMGEFDKALAYTAHAIELARELGNPFAEAANHHYQGIIRDQQGEWAFALNDYEVAKGIAESAGDVFRLYLIEFMEGRAHVMLGNPERGYKLIEESLSLADQIGTKFLLGQAKCCLATCTISRNSAEATSFCREAIELADEAGDKFSSALAFQVLSDSLSAATQPDLPLAEEAIRHAILVFQEIGAQPELARSQLKLSHLLGARNAQEEARFHFTQATELFRTMGMNWDLNRA